MAADFAFGIEEEYFLADRMTGHSPEAGKLDRFHEIAAARSKSASHELLKGQIEVQSEPSTSLDATREALAKSRAELAQAAGDCRMFMFAAGSHPLAQEREQHTTEMERYSNLEREFGLVAGRSMVCAMHVHVEVPDPDRRIDLMNRITPYLPLFYALSTSSPFWEGRNTKLKGYRLAAFSEWPRMGLPELFADRVAYERYIDRLVGAGAIENASFVWWLIRPSNKFPTLELRICDSCTRLEDAISIAALYRCLLQAVHRRPELNAGFGSIERGLCAENIWQAQRRGIEARFVELSGNGTISVQEALDAALAHAAEDAVAQDSLVWAARCRDILVRGTSADLQLKRYNDLRKTKEADTALRTIVEDLASETTK